MEHEDIWLRAIQQKKKTNDRKSNKSTTELHKPYKAEEDRDDKAVRALLYNSRIIKVGKDL